MRKWVVKPGIQQLRQSLNRSRREAPTRKRRLLLSHICRSENACRLNRSRTRSTNSVNGCCQAALDANTYSKSHNLSPIVDEEKPQLIF